ncbi:MAG: DUF4282 domain-containing protein [Chromatiales bacterium]|jgi:hypothetical protein
MPADNSLFWDIVSFRVFVTPAVLLAMYYFGAIAVPALMFWFMRGSWHKTKDLLGEQAVARVRGSVSVGRKSRAVMLAGAVFMFLMLELFWRMMFEFLIAYFQIHNALTGSAAI